MTFCGPEDQVARREKFSQRHPGVSITYSYGTHEWNASWNGGKGARKIACRELKDLLNTLEKELDGRPAVPGSPRHAQ